MDETTQASISTESKTKSSHSPTRSLKQIPTQLVDSSKVRVEVIVDDATGYLAGMTRHRKALTGVKGLARADRVKAKIKRIDADTKRIEKLEAKIEQIKKRRAIEALALEEKVKPSLKIVRGYLSLGEYRDFRGE